MKNKLKQLAFEVEKIDILEENDNSFLKAKFWAISEGETRNGVSFTLDSIEKCIPTVTNKPVLAAYNKGTNEFEGHNDLGLKIDEESGKTYIDYDQGLFDTLTQRPIGVIPSESNAKIEDYNGKKWLTFDVLIWKLYSYQAVKLLESVGEQKISVEISASNFSVDHSTGELIINEFIFNGVTVIGVEEGIEGAHLKVGQFAESNIFSEFRQALMFAYERNSDKDDNFSGKEGEAELKFDLKGMGLNTFKEKLWYTIGQKTYTEENGWEMRKYWYVDLFPDENFVILEDCQNVNLVKVPFHIDNKRKVVLDFDNLEVVEIDYLKVNYGIEVKFNGPVRVDEPKSEKSLEDKLEVGGKKMEIKYFDKFVEKGYSPIGKSGDFVLFINEEVKDTVYKLDFNIIEETVEEEFDSVIEKMSVLEIERFEEKKEEEPKEESEKDSEKGLKLAKLEELVMQKEAEIEKLKAENIELGEKCAEFEFEKFKLEAQSFIGKVKVEFGEGQDKFLNLVNEKIESKEIIDEKSLKSFVAEQLLEKTLKQGSKEEGFSLNPDKEVLVKDKNSLYNLV